MNDFDNVIVPEHEVCKRAAELIGEKGGEPPLSVLNQVMVTLQGEFGYASVAAAETAIVQLAGNAGGAAARRPTNGDERDGKRVKVEPPALAPAPVNHQNATPPMPAAKKPAKKPKMADGDIGVWELGSPKKKVKVRVYKNNLLVDIREYYEKNDEWLPGKKGISLQVGQWKALVAQIQAIEATVDQNG